MLSRSKCSLLSVPLCAAVSTPTPVSQQQLLLSPSCPKPAQPRVLSNAQASAGSWGTSLPTTLAPNQGADQCWAQNYTHPSQLFPDSLVLRSSCRTLACLPLFSGPCLREPHFCIGRWHMLETSPPPTHTHITLQREPSNCSACSGWTWSDSPYSLKIGGAHGGFHRPLPCPWPTSP